MCQEAIYFGQKFKHVKTNIQCLKTSLEECQNPQTRKATALNVKNVWTAVSWAHYWKRPRSGLILYCLNIPLSLQGSPCYWESAARGQGAQVLEVYSLSRLRPELRQWRLQVLTKTAQNLDIIQRPPRTNLTRCCTVPVKRISTLPDTAFLDA